MPKLKEIAKDYPEVQRMVSEIEFGLKRETGQSQTGGDFEKVFQPASGTRRMQERRGMLRLLQRLGSRGGVYLFRRQARSFQGNEAVERYQKYNDILKILLRPVIIKRGSTGRDSMEKTDLIKGTKYKRADISLFRERQSRPGMPIKADLADQGQVRNVLWLFNPAISPKPKKFAALRPIPISRNINNKTA